MPSPQGFAARHIGLSPDAAAHMLDAIGVPDIETLMRDVVPDAIHRPGDLADRTALSEADAVVRLREIADRNQVLTSMIGLGYHDTITPLVIARNILENPAWYTAYTPIIPVPSRLTSATSSTVTTPLTCAASEALPSMRVPGASGAKVLRM